MPPLVRGGGCVALGGVVRLDECKYDVQFTLFSAPLVRGAHEVTEGTGSG